MIESSTWKDRVIDFMRRNNNSYFTAAWLSDTFGVDENDLDEFLDIEIAEGRISCLQITIDLSYRFVLKYNSEIKGGL